MAREYFCAYHSFLKSIEPLNDAERGRLFTACLEYSMTGAEPELRGNERYIFPMIREQIDRDAKKYDARCEQNRNNILRRYTAEYDRTRTSTKPTKAKTKAKTKEKGKEKEVQEKENSAEALLHSYSFSFGLQEALKDWLQYKSERREAYRPTGLKACLSEVKNKLSLYTEEQIIALIRECMANGWRGIIWDRLQGKGQQYVGRTAEKGTSTPVQQNQKYGNYV